MASVTDHIEDKLFELGRRFEITGWIDPCRFTPAETVENEAHEGKSVDPLWTVFVYKENIQSTTDPELSDGIARVRLRYTDAQLDALTVDQLAEQLTFAVTGRVAHEALESAFLNEKRLFDAHDESTLTFTSEQILKYLREGAG